MQNHYHINFPAVSRLPLAYPKNGKLWTQTLIGRYPSAVVDNVYFDQVLWKLPNTPETIGRTALIIFVTHQGLVSFRNVSQINVVQISYEKYMLPVKLPPGREAFVTNKDLYRNLTVFIDNSTSFRVASYGSTGNNTFIHEFERTQ